MNRFRLDTSLDRHPNKGSCQHLRYGLPAVNPPHVQASTLSHLEQAVNSERGNLIRS